MKAVDPTVGVVILVVGILALLIIYPLSTVFVQALEIQVGLEIDHLDDHPTR